MRSLIVLLSGVILMMLIIGCSKSAPAEVDQNANMDSGMSFDTIPVIVNDDYSNTGLLGAYSLSLSKDGSSAELTPIRTTAIGESYIVDGKGFFVFTPCINCMKLDSIALFEKDYLELTMSVKHPFPKGNLSEPPSSRNRLDLDVFDLALVVQPVAKPSTTFAMTKAYTDYLYNADGYTKELSRVLNDTAALPYKICYTNPDYNRFAMGTDYQSFSMILKGSDATNNYNMFLTMGYGASAKKPDRLIPSYYLPEFNRKAAWKVKVYPPTWNETDTSTQMPVYIDIFDWNHGATVGSFYPDPANKDHIRASSNIQSVSVHIPGMINSTVEAATTDTETDGFLDPVTYTAMVANQNGLPEGSYVGLVRVTDTRMPGSSVFGGETDTLVHTADGVNLQWYSMTEFATYQSFNALVASNASGLEIGYSTGGIVYSIDRLNGANAIVTTGYFEGTEDFDPGPLEDFHTSNGVRDIFVSRFDDNWQHMWTVTIGGSIWDEGHGVSITASGVFVTGYFSGMVDFDPGSGVQNKASQAGTKDIFLLCLNPDDGSFRWVQTMGSGLWDEGIGVDADSTGIYFCGFYQNSIDFDPSGLIDQRTSSGSADIFVTKFLDNGTYGWTYTLGAGLWDEGIGVQVYSGQVYITGYFQGTIDFNRGVGTDNHTSAGLADIFILNITNGGVFGWAETMGGSRWDEGHALECGLYIYLTGSFEGTADFNPAAGQNLFTSNGEKDIFVSYYTLAGCSYMGTQTMGGSIWDEGYGLAIDASNNVYITGYFEDEVDFNPGPQQDLRNSMGEECLFVSKFDVNLNYLWAQTWDSTGSSIGRDIASGSVFVVGDYTKWMDLDPDGGEDWHLTGDNASFLLKLSDPLIMEIEPNNTCSEGDQNPVFEGITISGSIRAGADNDDYFNIMGSGFPVTITLTNKSGSNIDLYLYDSACAGILGSSTNSGGADELIVTMLNSSVTYKILVVNFDDGDYSMKDYNLEVQPY